MISTENGVASSIRQSESYLWARRSVGVITLAGLLGCLLFFLQVPKWDLVRDLVFFLGISAGLYSLSKLYIVLGSEALLSNEERKSFRNSVLYFGPAGALEVFLSLRKMTMKRAG